jgi:hypothetical protein
MINSRAVLSVVSAGALALAVSACGSSSSTATAAAAGSGSNSAARYQARLKLAKCMRSHGINVPDPSANGGPPAGGGGAFQQIRSNPNFRTAIQACQKLIGQSFGFANLTATQRAQFQQDAVKFAECMRAHNIDIPDPTSNGAGGLGIFRSISPTERNSPSFQTAIKACQSNLPRRPGGGPGGPPGP